MRPRRRSRALAPPAIAVLVTVVVLSYSRSAVLASVAGLALWFAVVPLRLRGAFVLGLGLLGAAAISGWALATHALTHDHVASRLPHDAGHGFGIVSCSCCSPSRSSDSPVPSLSTETVLARRCGDGSGWS